jgi:hypothetical protein
LIADSRLDRLAVLCTAALISINLATSGRWAAVPGALRGWRWPLVVAALAAAVASSVRRPRADTRSTDGWLPRVLLVCGGLVLMWSFFADWFPVSSWNLIPFSDDWPPRYASTVDGLSLLRRGAFGGWRWDALGGYSIATDITQNLTVAGALPMLVFGNATGFHVLHLLLFALVPTLVLLDLGSSSSGLRMAAAGLVAFGACTFSWGIIRSGDSNSLAGVVGVLAVLWASGRTRERRLFSFALLTVALTLTAYSHIGFFAYAIGLLGVEAAYYKDWRQLRRSALAVGLALAASAPVTYELIRYPGEFNFNNVMYQRPAAVDWTSVLRRVAYNVQILGSPSRWFGDQTKLFMPLVLVAAWRREGRAGFYAWGALFVVGLTLLNVPEAGYAFQRPAHLLVAITPVAIAWFALTRATSALQAWTMLGLAVLCLPIVSGTPVPHERSAAAFAPQLVQRIGQAAEEIVLLENNPHREVSVGPQHSEKSLYGTHYEALVPGETGKRLYAGYWDGWQFTPFRGEMLAGGAWQGHMLSPADRPGFVAEMQRWGVRHLFVWSQTSRDVLGSWPEFRREWEDGPWREFVLIDRAGDVGIVSASTGGGELVDRDPLHAVIRLSNVKAGDLVLVRTHYHPAWQAFAAGAPVALKEVNGQLGFDAPSAGSYDVRLEYPARRTLTAASASIVALVLLWDWRRSRAGRHDRRIVA